MLIPRTPAPRLDVPLLGGGRWTLAERRPETFGILVFYRGNHCPICKNYLRTLEAALDDVAAIGAEIVAVSMDDEARARATAEEVGISRLPVGRDMSEAVAREWSLYISSQRPGSSEPERFSEPGLVVVRPNGVIFFVQVQSAPFTRPPIGELLGGLKFVIANAYPARGDLTRMEALAHD